jgi:hypothetical protein
VLSPFLALWLAKPEVCRLAGDGYCTLHCRLEFGPAIPLNKRLSTGTCIAKPKMLVKIETTITNNMKTNILIFTLVAAITTVVLAQSSTPKPPPAPSQSVLPGGPSQSVLPGKPSQPVLPPNGSGLPVSPNQTIPPAGQNQSIPPQNGNQTNLVIPSPNDDQVNQMTPDITNYVNHEDTRYYVTTNGQAGNGFWHHRNGGYDRTNHMNPGNTNLWSNENTNWYYANTNRFYGNTNGYLGKTNRAHWWNRW